MEGEENAEEPKGPRKKKTKKAEVEKEEENAEEPKGSRKKAKKTKKAEVEENAEELSGSRKKAKKAEVEKEEENAEEPSGSRKKAKKAKKAEVEENAEEPSASRKKAKKAEAEKEEENVKATVAPKVASRKKAKKPAVVQEPEPEGENTTSGSRTRSSKRDRPAEHEVPTDKYVIKEVKAVLTSFEGKDPEREELREIFQWEEMNDVSIVPYWERPAVGIKIKQPNGSWSQRFYFNGEADNTYSMPVQMLLTQYMLAKLAAKDRAWWVSKDAYVYEALLRKSAKHAHMQLKSD